MIVCLLMRTSLALRFARCDVVYFVCHFEANGIFLKFYRTTIQILLIDNDFTRITAQSIFFLI